MVISEDCCSYHSDRFSSYTINNRHDYPCKDTKLFYIRKHNSQTFYKIRTLTLSGTRKGVLTTMPIHPTSYNDQFRVLWNYLHCAMRLCITQEIEFNVIFACRNIDVTTLKGDIIQ